MDQNGKLNTRRMENALMAMHDASNQKFKDYWKGVWLALKNK